jgi:hypothetical protein
MFSTINPPNITICEQCNLDKPSKYIKYYENTQLNLCKWCVKNNQKTPEHKLAEKQKTKLYQDAYNKKYREKIKIIIASRPPEISANQKERIQKYFSEFKNTVEEKGGTCLSNIEDYKTAHIKLKVQCIMKHEFDISLNNLKKCRWCPKCKLSIAERIVQDFLEHLFDKQFIKIRPDWLLTLEDTYLEIDHYNEELKLAIETNGVQHYKFIPFFHRTFSEYTKRILYDAYKKFKCAKIGINFITIPYTINYNNIPQYIYDQLIKYGYDINKDKLNTFKFNDCFKLYKIYESIHKIVSEKKGIILDSDFLTKKSRIKLICSKNHEWNTKCRNIIAGAWCPICANKRSDETRQKISETLKRKKIDKTESHKKRSITMTEQREKIRESITEKECKKCNNIKLISLFNKKSDTKDGYQPYCRECINIIKRNKKLILKL